MANGGGSGGGTGGGGGGGGAIHWVHESTGLKLLGQKF